MDENEEYFQRQASHRQSRRRFRKINQKGERQTIIDTVDPYPTGKPPAARGYHTVSLGCSRLFLPPSLPPLLLLGGAEPRLGSALFRCGCCFPRSCCALFFGFRPSIESSRSLSDFADPELLYFDVLVILVRGNPCLHTERLWCFFLWFVLHFYPIVLSCCCLFV